MTPSEIAGALQRRLDFEKGRGKLAIAIDTHVLEEAVRALRMCAESEAVALVQEPPRDGGLARVVQVAGAHTE